jgi:hypothetical protein
MSAGLRRRVVDTPRRYPGVAGRGPTRFRPDEFVEARDGGLAVDGNLEPARSRPRDPKFIERGAEQRADIVGAVGEVVTDAANPAVVRHDAAAIAFDQAANEFLGGLLYEQFLPRLEADRP